ncbi:MAG: hypothetical protein PHH04_02025 [Thomasclavelia sp.]|nr:hypothetical protein [Thomasclavelia sp.]
MKIKRINKLLRLTLALSMVLSLCFFGVKNNSVSAEDDTLVTTPVPLVPGEASLDALEISSVIDGTDYTTTDGPGLDSAKDNNICRTFDTVQYTLSYSTIINNTNQTAAGFTEGDVYFKAVIPNAKISEVQFDTSAMNWAKDVKQVQDGSDIVLTGARHLTNGSLPTCIPGAGTLTFSVLVKAAKNGATYQPKFDVWMDGDEAHTFSVTAKNAFTVSATQAMNVKLTQGTSGKGYAEQKDSEGNVLGNGVIQEFDAKIQNGTTTTPKGAEAPKGKITFVVRPDGIVTNKDNGTTSSGTTKVAYVKVDDGDVTYKDNGDGSYTITVDNYDVPEMSYSTASPLDFLKVTIGVFQEQPKNIPGNIKYDISITDSDLTATSVSGQQLTPATAGTNDNQTVLDDDQTLKTFESTKGTYIVGCYMQQQLGTGALEIPFDGTVNNVSLSARRKDEVSPGEDVYLVDMLIDPTRTSYNASVNAADMLVKFDDKTIELTDNTNVQIISPVENDSQVSNGKTKVRFAAKPDGSGWTDSVECAKYGQAELVFYDSLKELEDDGKVCVGVAVEIRNVDIFNGNEARGYTGGTLEVTFNAKVKNDPNLIKNKAVAFSTSDNRYYSASSTTGYVPTVDDHIETACKEKALLEAATSSLNSHNSDNWIRNNWSVSSYDDNGNRVSGTDNWAFGWSSFVVGTSAKMTAQIETQGKDGLTKTVYDITAGEDTVDMVMKPIITSSEDCKINARYAIAIPEGCTIDPDSLYIGGTYDPATKTIIGGKKVEISDTSVSGDLTVSNVRYKATNISALGDLHYKVKISDDAKNGDSYTVQNQYGYSTENNAVATVGIKKLSFSIVKVGDIKFSKTVKTAEATGATDTQAGAKQGLIYSIGAENTSALDISDMKVLDVLPYNGDKNGSEYTGSYSVNGVALNLGGSKVSENGIKMYYTTSSKVQNKNYNSTDVDVTDSIWQEATNTGTDTEPVYTVDTKTTAVVITGNLPTGTKYLIDVALDTSKVLGSFGNTAYVSSPDLPKNSDGDREVPTNGTETEVVSKVNVTNTLTNIVTNNTAKTNLVNTKYGETLTAKDGYRLPETIKVIIGGKELTPAVDPSNPKTGEYSYDKTTGKVVIPDGSVTDDIEVIAEAVKVVNITNTLTNVTTNKPVKSTSDEKQPYEETLTSTPGYDLPDTIVVNIGGTPTTVTSGTPINGITYDKTTGKVTVEGSSVTDDVEIVVTATPKQFTVKFATDPEGSITGGDNQTVNYKENATDGAKATPSANHTFLGWEYNYTGLDGKTYKGTTTDYTKVPIMNDVTFTAKYASDNAVSATGNHGYVSTGNTTTPPTVGTNTNSTTDLNEVDSKFPGSVSFKPEENYTLDKIVIRDKDGNVIQTIDKSTTGEVTLPDGTIVNIVVNDDGSGTIVSENLLKPYTFDINFAPKDYKVTSELTYLTTSNPSTTVTYLTDYKTTLTPVYKQGEKYTLPKEISVTVGGKELKPAKDPKNPQPGEYGYDNETGEVIVPGGNITGDIVVKGVADVGVTNKLTNIITNNDQTSISVGERYEETISPEEGYRLPDTIKVTVSGVELTPASDPSNPQPGEYGYDKTTGKVIVPEGSVTGSIVVEAIAVKTVNLTSNITNGSNTHGNQELIDLNGQYTTTLVPDNGYEFPDSFTITIGDKTYTIKDGINEGGIVFNKTTGELTIPGDIVIDDVTITMECSKSDHSVVVAPNTNGSNNKTGVNTGDTVSAFGFVFMMLASGYVIVRKRKED